MATFEVSAHMTVRPGQLEGFKKQAAECIRITKEQDTHTLRYDWFLSSDGTECEVREAYTGPEGLIEHNKNIPSSIEGRKQFVTALLSGFSDYRAEIQMIVAEGDMVVARVEWTGTQDGPFQGRPATGNKLRFSTADFFRVENGKLAEHWDVVDSLPRAVALGLVPPPAR